MRVDTPAGQKEAEGLLASIRDHCYMEQRRVDMKSQNCTVMIVESLCWVPGRAALMGLYAQEIAGESMIRSMDGRVLGGGEI